MTKIAIILGSTRPGRKSEAVGNWVLEHAKKRSDATFEIVDIAKLELPLLDEPIPPSLGKYQNEHTKRWAAKVAEFDGYVFIAPEYNHGIPAALKNALDYVFAEWNNKAAGFVSYGSALGVRSVEHLRGVCGELAIATVRTQVMLSLFTDWEKFTTFKPDPRHEKSLAQMLDQLVKWSNALKTVRA
jgi:NAD(P)H-dependent FMN reductase